MTCREISLCFDVGNNVSKVSECSPVTLHCSHDDATA
jgi:hypothetical protein